MDRSQSGGRRGASRDDLKRVSRHDTTRGRSRQPPNRNVSFGQKSGRSGSRKPPNRTVSFDEFKKQRGRSGSRQPPNRAASFGQPKRKVRSMSPSLRTRGRDVQKGARGTSYDPAERNRMRGRSTSRDRFGNELLGKQYPSQKPEDNNISRRGMRSFRRIKKIGGHVGGKGRELSWCKLCQYIAPIVVILGASVGLLYATGNGDLISDTLDNLIPALDNSDLYDPSSGKNAPHWPENGNGLRVTIINALSNDWQTTFSLATADWMFGDPDAIEITEERGTPDPKCEAPDGKVIVCNGNYGDTKYRGINEGILNPRGQMVSSSARMNEYYLLNMGKEAWQYTMCHEIGHTLGLGHTDEDFDNEDLGNCMEYTDNFEASKRPDKSNYETLFDIYGPISSGDERLRQRQLRRGEHGSHLRTTADTDASDISTAALDHHPQVSVQRLRRRDPSNKKGDVDINTNATTADSTAVPDHIRHKKKEAVQKLLERIRNNHSDDSDDNIPAGHTHKDGWKLVHRKNDGEEHETELGEGYKVRVQLLLAH